MIVREADPGREECVRRLVPAAFECPAAGSIALVAEAHGRPVAAAVVCPRHTEAHPGARIALGAEETPGALEYVQQLRDAGLECARRADTRWLESWLPVREGSSTAHTWSRMGFRGTPVKTRYANEIGPMRDAIGARLERVHARRPLDPDVRLAPLFEAAEHDLAAIQQRLIGTPRARFLKLLQAQGPLRFDDRMSTVVLRAGTPLALMPVRSLTHDVAEVFSIAVEPGWQRRSLAEAIMLRGLTEAAAMGRRLVCYEATPGGRQVHRLASWTGARVASRWSVYRFPPHS